MPRRRLRRQWCCSTVTNREIQCRLSSRVHLRCELTTRLCDVRRLTGAAGVPRRLEAASKASDLLKWLPKSRLSAAPVAVRSSLFGPGAVDLSVPHARKQRRCVRRVRRRRERQRADSECPRQEPHAGVDEARARSPHPDSPEQAHPLHVHHADSRDPKPNCKHANRRAVWYVSASAPTH